MILTSMGGVKWISKAYGIDTIWFECFFNYLNFFMDVPIIIIVFIYSQHMMNKVCKTFIKHVSLRTCSEWFYYKAYFQS